MENSPTLFEDLSNMMVDGISSNYNQAVKKGLIYFENKRKKSFEDFTNHLLKGTAEKEKLEYERMFNITEDQYYALLKASIEDEEKDKSYIYANVYKSILNEKIEKQKYTRFIRLAKNLPYNAIMLLPIIYIYNTFHTKNKSLTNVLDEIYDTHRYEVNLLEQNYLLETPKGMKFSDSIITINNDFFNEITKVFFKEEDLVPLKYGIELWKEKNVLLFTDNTTVKGSVTSYIMQILKQNAINVNILDYSSLDFNQYSHIICVVKDSNLNYTNDFNFQGIKGNTKIIRVTKSKNISRGKILNLTIKEDKEKFKSEFMFSE